jgi:hypothetical protein
MQRVTQSFSAAQDDDFVGVLTKNIENKLALIGLRPGLCSGLSLLCLLLLLLVGCRSRLVEVTIVNQGPTMHVMEFDYPSASFGANQLAPGAKYYYRFKIQGSGPLSLQYEDASGHTRTAEGPKVNLGDQGSLLVNIDAQGAVTWNASLTHPK